MLIKRIDSFKNFIKLAKYSNSYTLFKLKGIAPTIKYLTKSFRNNFENIFFIEVEGYIIKANLDIFDCPSIIFEELNKKNISFEILSKGQSLPEFCYGIKQNEIERRLNEGHFCCVLRFKDEIVASLWIGLGKIVYTGPSVFLFSDHSTFFLEQNEAWIYDVICRSDFRKKGLATFLKHFTLLRLKNMRIKYVLGTIGSDNIGAMKADLRSGFELSEYVKFKKLFIFKHRIRKKLSKEDNLILKQKFNI